MIKYGKPSSDILEYKTSFFNENDKRLNDFIKFYDLYIQQPKRTVCKNCEKPLKGKKFNKKNVDYYICEVCGHLNGAYEDTDEFCSMLYTDDGGKAYARTYNSQTKEDYRKRVEDIYIPKVNFLEEALKEEGCDYKKMRYADFGAGSGYFVSALKNKKFNHVVGYEVSKSQVSLANAMIKEDTLIQHELADTVDLASKVEADVVSLIGVLEHVQYPREILNAFVNNRNMKYIFLSVPLFSICVLFEIVFNQVMPRHLAPAHTHLYTESSINHFCNEFGLERVSEWWFGTDMVDLYRNILVTLNKDSNSVDASDIWTDMFQPLIDDMQKAQDKNKAASEVHMLLKIKR